MKKKWMCSVLMATYNSAEFIEHTLHSIVWQTFADMEILIVDNNSEDNTADIIQAWASKDTRIVLYKSNDNLWAFGGLNFLLEKAQGEYVAIIDHDDIWHPDKIQKQVDFMGKNMSYTWCGSTFIDIWEWDNFGKYELFSITNVVIHSSLMFRNEGYRYDTTLRKYSDRDLMLHVLAPHGPIYRMYDDVFVLRRIRREGRNVSVKWASRVGIFTPQKITGVPRYECAYNILRFRYKRLYKLMLYICMPWKVTSLTRFVQKSALWKPHKDFVLKAFG